MLTICWAAKGGSGTTFTAAALALASDTPTVLVDLDGDLPLVLGVDDNDRAGVTDWLDSTAPAERFDRLEIPLGASCTLVPRGTGPLDRRSPRWARLAAALAARPGRVVVDAGTGDPPAGLCAVADAVLLVTRPCYVALQRAGRSAVRPTGVILVDEPGRRLRAADVEHTVGAPIVATLLLDPKIARAVDSGLLVSRLPRDCVRQLQATA